MRDILNGFYQKLNEKNAAAERLLRQHGPGFSPGFYNGHYHKNEHGEYLPDEYPIAVISVHGLCDAEIDFDRVSVSTKLTREQALIFNLEVLKNYRCEAFGMEDYLRDFYLPDMEPSETADHILASDEQKIAFYLGLPQAAGEDDLLGLLELLQNRSFYY